MQDKYNDLLINLRSRPKKWLITGSAGFIGSNLLEELLLNGQIVVGLDNFSTGHRRNLEEVREITGNKWLNFSFIEGDITDLQTCILACEGVDYVLHQAALGSVPRSIKDPIATNNTNVTGFLNLLVAAKQEGVKSLTYAASSSTYGDHPDLPKVEDKIGKQLSPYAVSKYVNELYANVFAETYGFKAIGLRYFNVYGRRQDPNGDYAAVIPKWIAAMVVNKQIEINGNGHTSRDFCYIKNVVQANILAAVPIEEAKAQVYNIAVGDRTSLNELYAFIKKILNQNGIIYNLEPVYKDFRPGDVLHSQADIGKARSLLGYTPNYRIKDGLDEAMPWYINYMNGGKKIT